jgi:hypothetical protein
MRVAVSFLVTFAFLIGVLVLATSLAESPEEGLPGVILVSDGEPQNLGVYSEYILQLRRVGSQEELEAALDGETRVVVLDRSVLDSMSTPYLRSQLARGVQFVGLNISQRELKTVTDWSGAWQIANPSGQSTDDPAAWTDAPAGVSSFYSLIRLNPHHSGASNGYLTKPGELFQTRLGQAANFACRDLAPWSTCVDWYLGGYQYRLLPTPTPASP